MKMFYAITEGKYRVPIPNAQTWEEAASMADIVGSGKFTIVCCEYGLISKSQRVYDTKGGFVDKE